MKQSPSAGCKASYVDIPSTLEIIGDGAFASSSLKSVTIPESVQSIGNFAFDSCSSLETAEILNPSVTIGNYAFDECPNLTIYGQKDSTAQKYADEDSIPFISLGGEGPVDIIPGDLDGDEEITANDAITALRASIGLEETDDSTIEIADVDGDGEITANDAFTILRASIGLEEI